MTLLQRLLRLLYHHYRGVAHGLSQSEILGQNYRGVAHGVSQSEILGQILVALVKVVLHFEIEIALVLMYLQQLHELLPL
ncbi:unnamed protein product [Trifolium pratense]|uniref:Uncharacterized protein n=1 Tax=Trifolium pratense TaxID=57577 RepID=A0ACB0K6U6_TRIPR|nr:unnamed protein product [Trifolium pratense]